MKTIIPVIIIAFIAIIAFESCKKLPSVKPGNKLLSDTSTTLISNTKLVGNWTIVTDSLSYQTDTVYRGTPADHYIFTTYGNLYIRSGFNNEIDTAVYTIKGDTLSWQYSYASLFGKGGKTNGYNLGFIISAVTAHSLILTQGGFITGTAQYGGRRYERITFKK